MQWYFSANKQTDMLFPFTVSKCVGLDDTCTIHRVSPSCILGMYVLHCTLMNSRIIRKPETLTKLLEPGKGAPEHPAVLHLFSRCHCLNLATTQPFTLE